MIAIGRDSELVQRCLGRAGLLIAGLLAAVPTVSADTFDLSWDNDLLTASDKGYTNGGRLSWLTTPAEEDGDCSLCLSAHARDALSGLPGIGSAGNRHALAFSLRQLMFTPGNIQASEPLYDDIPYVGYLDGSMALWSWNEDWITGYGIILGVVGPDSGARRTQELVHKITGSTDPEGWNNQLGQDLIGGLEAYHARHLYRTSANDGVQTELTWGAGATASNFISNVQTGLIWRIGTHLPGDFLPLSSGSSGTLGLPGAASATAAGWSLFAGFGGEWVPYSYLDVQSGRYTYQQRALIGQAGIGGGWHCPGFQISLVLKATTSPEQGNKDALTFGTLNIIWRP